MSGIVNLQRFVFVHDLELGFGNVLCGLRCGSRSRWCGILECKSL